MKSFIPPFFGIGLAASMPRLNVTNINASSEAADKAKRALRDHRVRPLPHQGDRECARRLKRMAKAAS